MKSIKIFTIILFGLLVTIGFTSCDLGAFFGTDPSVYDRLDEHDKEIAALKVRMSDAEARLDAIEADLEDISEEVAANLTLYCVEDLDSVIQIALMEEGAGEKKKAKSSKAGGKGKKTPSTKGKSTQVEPEISA